jgi:NhaP-type Na+/H+ and K+/H+ antiporter
MAQSINLIPQLTEEEIQEIEVSGKRNFFGVFFVFIVVLVSLVVLGGNLYTQVQYNNKKEILANKEKEVIKLQYVEIKQKTLNNKFSTYSAVEDRDFYSNVVLEYLINISEQLATVDSLFLDENLEFEVSGKTTSYKNVARLWHEMSRQEDYFEYVNLGRASKIEKDDGGGIRFSLSGKMKRDSLDKLSEDD